MTGDRALQEAEALYGLPPAEFTAARNSAAARLRDEGDRESSARVKALRKPVVAAWVVNLLVRRDAEEMAQVLDLGASLRQAQADLDGQALRELGRQRRRLVAAVAGKGRGLAKEAGVALSESVLRQVEETLHAAMVDTDAEAAVRTGLLVDPLSAAGAGTLRVASAVADHTALGGPGPAAAPTAPQPGLRVVPQPEPDREQQRREEQRRARAAAEKALRKAERDLVAAKRELDSRDHRVSDLRARTLQVNGEIDELRRRIDDLEDRLDKLDAKVGEAEEEREAATEEVTLAEQAVQAARAELDGLDSSPEG